MNFNSGIFRSERRRDMGDVPCTASSTDAPTCGHVCLLACNCNTCSCSGHTWYRNAIKYVIYLENIDISKPTY